MAEPTKPHRSDRARTQRRLEWAKDEFPDQHPSFVLAACDTLRVCRHPPSRENIEGRMRAIGRWK